MVKQLAVQIDEPGEYVYRGYETASAWDKRVVEPGVYPLVGVTIDHRPVDPDREEAYYLVARIPAVMTESYYVNRLLTASSVSHKTDLETPSTVFVQMYRYEVEAGKTVLGGIGRIVEVTE